MSRSFDKHLDNQELNALVPSSSETGNATPRLAPDRLHDAQRHVQSCQGCAGKVAKYRQLVSGFAAIKASKAASAAASCPRGESVDWHELAAGLWPELKARELLRHAALCDYCGPLLRAAASANIDSTTQNDSKVAHRITPLRPGCVSFCPTSPLPHRAFVKWLSPVVALILTVGLITAIRRPTRPLSGSQYAEFAVRTHNQHAKGNLALDIRSDSQQVLNAWFREKLPYSLALPASPAAAGEQRPYRLEGARLVQVGGKTAAYIAYQMQTGTVSLMVVPDSVAIASGGTRVDYKKVSFHYDRVNGYKVVTWSQHGLTYAQISQEGNSTQQSCMVCHSPMRDRDLSQTPTPLPAQRSSTLPVLQ